MARAKGSPIAWAVLALLALLVGNVVVTPGFLSVRVQDGHLYGSVVDILRNGAPVMIVALGMTLVIATRGIDLSVGAVAAIAGSVACVSIAGAEDPTSAGAAVVAMTTALALCIVLGLWNGFLVSVLGIQPIIATLVLMTAGRGIAQLVTGGNITTVTNSAFRQLGAGYLLVPVAVLVVAAAILLVWGTTRRTALGTFVESVGINPEASRLAGVRSRTIVFTVYVFSAFCAGLAGLMIASNVSSADANSIGLYLEMDAILAVVIGGTSLAGGRYSLPGTVVGALLIQTLTTTVYTAGIPTQVTLVFKAVVVIAVCLLQSPRARAVLVRRRAPRPLVPEARASGDAPAPSAALPDPLDASGGDAGGPSSSSAHKVAQP
ncbi:ABC transporter permease [Vallicoccus soli]|uniref:ABC transporter permease n=1 Tax=Vallicoccus soli TaxID=2339232 RepID=A0A3A3Z246_9ACTN|nr:ABC transporter permease [Vallicoccus soli]